MKTARVAFPLVMIALVAILLAIGQFGYQYEFHVFVFPLVLGLFVILMCLLAFLSERNVKDEDLRAQATEAEAKGEVMLLADPNTWVQFGALLALLGVCWVLGFIPGIVIFVFAYLWRAGWKPTVALAYGAGAGFAIWFLFYFLFFTPLPFWPIFMR